MKILIIDDEEELCQTLKRTLKYEGMSSVETCSQPGQAVKLINRKTYDIVLLDICMPELDGLQILEAMKPQHPDTEFIMITGVDDVKTAVKAIRLGAYDYLVKPIDASRLALSIEHAYERKAYSVSFHNTGNKKQADVIPAEFATIITQSHKMLSLIKYADVMARSGKPILITGESGTGKELFARSIHDAGSYANGPFIPINVSSVPDGLFESQFFGHAKGAFTGAIAGTAGYFESANRGTLFLDEIGELPNNLQIKLLRALEDGRIFRVGETKSVNIDVQIVSATNKDLMAACHSGTFRFDLYYRLGSARIHIPPLRERPEDIMLLTRHFLEESCRKYNKSVNSISHEAEHVISHATYAGNVRELKQIIENAVLMADSSSLLPQHLMIDIPFLQNTAPQKACSLKENQEQHIAYVMQLVQGNRYEAAQILGISVRQLQRKLAEIKK